MPIKFPCPKCHRNLKIADTYAGQTLRCPAPNCGANITPEIVSLNKELSEIEAVIVECENKIRDGRHSVAIVKQRILEIADPSELMAKVNAGDHEWVEAYKRKVQRVSELDTIDIKRLHVLRNQHPNNSRVVQLGYRAADCYMKLGEIHLTAGEAPGQQEMLDDSRKMMLAMFPQWVPKPSVPANQSHLKAQEARERVERQQREEQERRARLQREQQERQARQEREERERRARQEAEERYKQDVQSGRISYDMCPHCNVSARTCNLLIKLQNQSSRACRNFYQAYTMGGLNPAEADWRAAFCSTSKWVECAVNVNEQRGGHR